jgi:hypothetical protein
MIANKLNFDYTTYTNILINSLINTIFMNSQLKKYKNIFKNYKLTSNNLLSKYFKYSLKINLVSNR